MIGQLNVALIRKQRGLFFDMLSMGVCTTRHWQTSSRLVQELNVCTVHISVLTDLGVAVSIRGFLTVPHSGIELTVSARHLGVECEGETLGVHVTVQGTHLYLGFL